jgi:ATP-dependent Clp protease ATP-binding subunit ClpB
MTSNIGSQFIMEDLPVDERNRRVMEALRGHFRPEFLNRIDETIIFDRLADKEITSIVDIQLKRLLKRLDQQNIRLELTDKAKKFLAKEGYDPAYGARPLKRVIQQQILNPLSVAILDGEFGEGDKIVAEVEKDHLEFRKK